MRFRFFCWYSGCNSFVVNSDILQSIYANWLQLSLAVMETYDAYASMNQNAVPYGYGHYPVELSSSGAVVVGANKTAYVHQDWAYDDAGCRCNGCEPKRRYGVDEGLAYPPANETQGIDSGYYSNCKAFVSMDPKMRQQQSCKSADKKDRRSLVPANKLRK